MHKHRFVDKHPIGGSILTGFFLLLINEALRTLMYFIHIAVFKEILPVFSILYMLIGAFITFFIYKQWFAPEFAGALSGGSFKKGLLLSLPIIVYWIVTTASMIVDKVFELKPVTMTVLLVSLTAGLGEELAFRHGMISTMLRKHNREDQLLKVLLISSMVFGFFHLFNIVVGADPLSTLIQVITSCSLGIFFGSLYLCSGNLWPSIIVHTLHDIVAICTTAAVSESGVITGGFSLSDIVDVIGCAALAVLAIVRYLSADKRKEIVEIWDRKWNRDDTETVTEEV